jgi:hypothetical protein
MKEAHNDLFSKLPLLPPNANWRRKVTALLERPQKSETKFTIMYREHKELLERLAPGEKTRVLCCAAKLINSYLAPGS